MNSNQLSILRSPSALPHELFGIGRGLEARARLVILGAVVEMLPQRVDPTSFHVVNHFESDMYAREIHMPAGSFGVGKIHKLPHSSILSKGKCIVADSLGERVIEAPATFISGAGMQRAVYVLEDAIWTTTHNVKGLGLSDDSTELEIRAAITADDYNDSALPAFIEGELE
jgi:hypothetical protein